MNKEELTNEDILNTTGSILDTMLDYVDNSNKELKQLQQENEQLKDNWNKLREYIINKYTEYEKETLDFFYGYKVCILSTRDKMQELESGDNNE